jgi:hypothetical protein
MTDARRVCGKKRGKDPKLGVTLGLCGHFINLYHDAVERASNAAFRARTRDFPNCRL